LSRALYRTYRSRSFDEIVGQEHVTKLLGNAIKTGKIAHAYLLTGPRGVGKTSVARIIAHAVNELEYSEDTHLDIIEIDAASNRRIDDIRDLRDKVHIAPVSAPYKVYIIDEVHMLTGESFNALLKTLEEPPEHVIFILATTEVHKLPATIISRTQRFHFRSATNEDITRHLKVIAKKEKIDYDEQALDLIASHAGGSFRDSVSLLDQLSGLSEKITAELVQTVLGMAEQQRVETMIDALTSGAIDTLVTELEAVQAAGVSAVVLTEQLSRTIAIRAKINHHLYLLLDALTDVPKAHDPYLKLIATMVRFAKPASHKTAAMELTKTPTFAAKPSSLRTKTLPTPQPSAIPAAKNLTPEPAATTAEETLPAPAATDVPAGSFDWEKVLQTIKKHHPPMFSVLSRATMTYDEISHQLTLTFAYVLHRKKLENPLYRKQLGSVIYNLFQFQPEIITTDTKSAAALNPDAQAIAAIMGGGEPVSGTI
jgi:DNA polymerase-3 subunit gamma/tau